MSFHLFCQRQRKFFDGFAIGLMFSAILLIVGGATEHSRSVGDYLSYFGLLALGLIIFTLTSLKEENVSRRMPDHVSEASQDEDYAHAIASEWDVL